MARRSSSRCCGVLAMWRWRYRRGGVWRWDTRSLPRRCAPVNLPRGFTVSSRQTPTKGSGWQSLSRCDSEQARRRGKNGDTFPSRRARKGQSALGRRCDFPTLAAAWRNRAADHYVQYSPSASSRSLRPLTVLPAAVARTCPGCQPASVRTSAAAQRPQGSAVRAPLPTPDQRHGWLSTLRYAGPAGRALRAGWRIDPRGMVRAVAALA